MASLDQLDEDTDDLLRFALDYAIDNAGLSAEGFTPFGVTSGEDGRHLTRFVAGGGDLEQSIAAGRQALREVDDTVTSVVLAWDGYVTRGGEQLEAVLVECYQVGQETGALVAQRYRRTGSDLVLEGDPILLAQPEPLVRSVRSGASGG